MEVEKMEKIEKPANIAILASGTGTNAINLLTRQLSQQERGEESPLKVKIVLVVINNLESPLIKVMEERFPDMGLVITAKTISEYEILRIFTEWQIKWVYLCGYMRILSRHFLQHFPHPELTGISSVINIHPSLLPKFPGLHSYEKCFKSEEKVGGVTIHFVDSGVDTGPIIMQREFPKKMNESLSDFSNRGKELEWKMFGDIFQTMLETGTIAPLQRKKIENADYQPIKQQDGNILMKEIIQSKISGESLDWTPLLLKHKSEKKHQVFWVRLKNQTKHEDQVHWDSYAARIIDTVDMELLVGGEKIAKAFDRNQVQVVHFQRGLTDNPANSFCDLLSLVTGKSFEAHSGKLIEGFEIINPLIECSFESKNISITEIFKQISKHNYFAIETSSFDKLYETYALLNNELETFQKISDENHWALSTNELKVIKDFYHTPEIQAKRRSDGLPIDPTDIEMEVFAQTWSEHCKHKIFAAKIDYQDSIEEFTVDGLFSTYIKAPTEELRKTIPWAISVFKDNAGIVRFHDDFDFCIKVETHNSPSALDPYGGALTGLLGVHRDIMGTGLGAKPVANTDVLLFGNPDFEGDLPKGLHHPKSIFEGVHHGIQDAGNKSGIPTINGAIHFDDQYCGKPIVYCGSVGILPKEIKGIPTHAKGHRAGDYIVMVGGAVGLDGIHGATSSSLGMDEKTPLGMVQIGDPFTQKKMLDFMLVARDQLLFNSLTDNGAGGLSSSIGEMAEKTGGAKVDLSKVPLKYPGLRPWQIFVSESQERLTLSVPKENWEALSDLAKKYSIHADIVGEFTRNGFLELYFDKDLVGKIEMQFLHQGLPQMQLSAKWDGPQALQRWNKSEAPKILNHHQEYFEFLLNNPTIASKEKWVRQYDQEVQSASALRPYGGMDQTFPNHAGVLWPGAYGAQGYSGVGVASGLCPQMSDVDTELMALMAADEAVRNLVVTGINPDWIALVDNFCWPDPIESSKNPDGPHKLAQLVRAARGIQKIALAYRMPFVSGKDSMKNDFYGANAEGKKVKISALPTLLITSIGKHPDVRKIITNETSVGSHLYLLDSINEYSFYFGYYMRDQMEISSLTQMSELKWELKKTLELYREFFAATQSGVVEGAADLSEGGLSVALFEMLLGSKLSINIETIENESEKNFLYNELPGRILVSVRPDKAAEFEAHFPIHSRRKLGVVFDGGKPFSLTINKRSTINLETCETLYRGRL
ncbi:MAG: AIR synthase-related protein [Bacteriovoracaceae bacterium]|nr:AIR synthase-related protein [Bacteriovoracaceae bacterium]